MAHPDDVRRRWFSDSRHDGRQMELSWHPDERIVIVSLWSATVCRATFRLPIDDAPDVIEVLVGAIGDAARQGGPPGRDPMPAILERWRQRTRRSRGTIVPITEHPAH